MNAAGKPAWLPVDNASLHATTHTQRTHTVTHTLSLSFSHTRTHTVTHTHTHTECPPTPPPHTQMSAEDQAAKLDELMGERLDHLATLKRLLAHSRPTPRASS